MLKRWQILIMFSLLYFFISSISLAEEPVVVRAVPVVTGTISGELSLTADIAPNRQVNVIPEVSGKLEKINVELGDSVEKGEILAKIENEDILLQVKQAEAAFTLAKINYDKAKDLSKIKAEADLKRAEVAFESAQAQLELIQATARDEFFSNLIQAEAALTMVQAQLQKAEEGAREEEIERAEAAYQQALANFETAKRDLERAEEDYSRGAIPEQQLDRVKLSYQVAEAQLKSAHASLELVKKGAREEDIQSARAQVKQAEARADYLKRLKDVESWKNKIKATRVQWENARTNFELAKKAWEESHWEKDIELVQAQLEQAEANLELIRSRLEDTKVKAPISGVISARFADEGAMVGPGQPLLSIVDIDTVKVILHITETDLEKIKSTRKIRIIMENYLDELLPVQKINISPMVDPMSRKLKVEIKIPNPGQRIKPGMFPRVKLFLIEEEALLIPEEALFTREGEDYVFVVEKNLARLKKVITGLGQGDLIQIIQGLKEGEMVIVEGQSLLKGEEPVSLKK